MGIVEKCVLIGGLSFLLLVVGYVLGTDNRKDPRGLSVGGCVVLLLAIFGAAVLAQRAFDFGYAFVVRPSPADADSFREVGGVTSQPGRRA